MITKMYEMNDFVSDNPNIDHELNEIKSKLNEIIDVVNKIDKEYVQCSPTLKKAIRSQIPTGEKF